jgi:hypothetical protein
MCGVIIYRIDKERALRRGTENEGRVLAIMD